MHILNLSKRNGQAQERMLTAAKLLADAARIDSALIDALSASSTIKDPAVRAMQEREAVADLLEAIAIAAHLMPAESAEDSPETGLPAMPEDVTTVTDEPESKPMDESLPGPEPLGAPGETGEELPEPVLEEGTEPRAMGGLVDPGTTYLVGTGDTEVFVPAAEEATAEEPAADKSKSAKKRTSTKK